VGEAACSPDVVLQTTTDDRQQTNTAPTLCVGGPVITGLGREYTLPLHIEIGSVFAAVADTSV